jgi:hypothetical protein
MPLLWPIIKTDTCMLWIFFKRFCFIEMPDPNIKASIDPNIKAMLVYAEKQKNTNKQRKVKLAFVMLKNNKK